MADEIKPEVTGYFTGALPSPRHKLAAAYPHRLGDYAPDRFARIPARLSYWQNNRFGTCVTTEEAFAKGGDGLWVEDSEVYAWAKKRRYLNGATLTEVMDDMQTEGLISGGKTWEDGGYFSVDWEDTHMLCDAIYAGVVKIGVASSQLPTAATGWHLFSARKDRAIDHCVALCGYGPMKWLFEQVGSTMPDGTNPNEIGYLLFTWGSIGVISQTALNAICGEAWVRKPTTVGVTPIPPPTPIPDPTPVDPPPQPPAPLPPDPTPAPTDWAAIIKLILGLLIKLFGPVKAAEMVAEIERQHQSELAEGFRRG